MSKSLDARVPVTDREAFAAIADILIPAHGTMPAASDVGVHLDGLDKVIRFRPDLLESFREAMKQVAGQPASAAADLLFAAHPELFQSLGLIASGAYYMHPEVRRLIGYPGQESLTYDTVASPPYVNNGALDEVLSRGPVYRPTPGQTE